MRMIIVLAIVAAVAARPEEGFYDEKYENFNVKELIENLRLLKSYVLCFLGKGKCTPEGNDFKKWIPEAVQSNCSKCTEKQKVLVAEVIKAIIDKLSDDWAELSKEYNPDGKYTEELNQFVQKYAPN